MLCHDSSKSGIWAPDKCSTSCWAAWCNFNVKVPFRDWMYFWSQTFKVWTELKLFLLPSLLLPITHSPSSFSLSLSLSPSSPSLYLSPSLLLPITLSLSLLLQITFSLSLPSSPHLSLSLWISIPPCVLSFPSLSFLRCSSGCCSCCLCQSVGCCIDDNCDDMQEKDKWVCNMQHYEQLAPLWWQ